MSTIIRASRRSASQRIRFSLQKYIAVLRVSIANNLAYLAEVFFRALLLVVLVFITRDILFIQWCTLTRMRQPVLKGFFFLCLYYVAAAVVSAIAGISGEASGITALSILTPVGIFDPRVEWLHFSAGVYEGLALQAGLIAVIVVGISNRLGRVGMVAAVSGD